MIAQTVALFADAYRYLNAKKLFWVTLGLTALFVLVFAAIGVREEGLTLLAWDVPLPASPLDLFGTKANFYKLLFIWFGFQFWLSWIAAILALVSTCGIVPDFVAGGTIELTLSKPIGRARLFLTKYLTGLLFVFLQVGVFTLASFGVIAIRGGEAAWAIFLAVPLVLLFFSYLYAVQAVVGLLTRSAIASLLMTLLFWFVVFLVHTVETGVFVNFRTLNEQAKLVIEGRIAQTTEEIRSLESAGAGNGTGVGRELERARERLGDLEADLAEANESVDFWRRWHAIAFGVKSVLPKTAETIELLRRWVIEGEEFAEINRRFNSEGTEEGSPFGGQEVHGVWISQRVVAEEVRKEIDGRSIGWIIGTSLAFEVGVLALGCLLFIRRDF